MELSIEELTEALSIIDVPDKKIQVYLQTEVYGLSNEVVSDNLNLAESTVQVYRNDVSNSISQLTTLSNIFRPLDESEIEDSTVIVPQADSPPKELMGGEDPPALNTNTELIRFNSTQLSHGETSPSEYPSVPDLEDPPIVVYMKPERIPTDISIADKDPSTAAKIYESIIPKLDAWPSVNPDSNIGLFITNLLEEICAHEGTQTGNFVELHSVFIDLFELCYQNEFSTPEELTEEISNKSGITITPNAVPTELLAPPEELPPADLGGLKSSLMLSYASSPILRESVVPEVTVQDLFRLPSELRAFAATSTLASIIDCANNNPDVAPLQLIVQNAGWVYDLPLIKDAIDSNSIYSLTLLHEYHGNSTVSLDEGLETISQYYDHTTPDELKRQAKRVERKPKIKLTTSEVEISSYSIPLGL